MSYYVGDVIPSKRVLSTAILLTILVTAILFVGVMAWWLQANETNEYEYVEVREYEGQDLSSISNFRENSIKGSHMSITKLTC